MAVLTRSVLLYIPALLLGCVQCADITQEEVNYMAHHLEVHYLVNDNINHPYMRLTVTLRNGGEQTMVAQGWSLYFSHIRILQPSQLVEDGGHYITRDGIQLGEHKLKLFHVNGVLFRIDPMEDFTPLAKGQEISLPMEAQAWEVSRTDVMPNWYIAAEGLQARIVVSTSGQSLNFVAPFTEEVQYKRSKLDEWSPYTHRYRYDMFPDEKKADDVRIIPNVIESSFEAESMSISGGDWIVVYDMGSKFTANFLAEHLNMRALERADPAVPSSLIIDLKVDPSVDAGATCTNNKEAYTVSVDTTGEKVTVVGREDVGLFHGVQSLLAMASHGKGTLQKGNIKDCPRFEYRGMHADVARNFFSKETILRLLDMMSMYKLNKFHFHLTDDEGWRLEIPGLPELTDIGARRCHDPSGDACIMPQLGSPPNGGGPGTGYYTVDEYKQILQYAQDRHILVIPEFDMPGHAHAAINAMKARERKTGSSEYLLTDPDDTSRYLSVQAFIDNAMDPCMNSTYTFIKKVMDEVSDMHASIQPLTMFNFGGDETAHTAWVNSTACARLISTTDVDKKALKKLFAVRASEVAEEMGLSLGGWEDGLMFEGSANLPFNLSDLAVEEVYAYTWNNIWEWGSGSRAYRLANAGYKTVLSHATNLYFDHPNEPDPEERGYYWATRWTNSFKTFGYMPDKVYDNMDYDLNGKVISKDEICERLECTPLIETENIVGIQGQLWSETIRTKQQFDAMVYPRLIALAERAWHKASWESEMDPTKRNTARRMDWDEWANLVGHHELSRLDQLDIHYHILPPGAMLIDNTLKVRAEFPGTRISASQDKGITWCDVIEKITIDPDTEEVLIRAGSADGRRFSRHSKVDIPHSTSSSAQLMPASSSLFLVTLLGCLMHRLCGL